MRIRHARVELELHELSRRDGPALLLLHALGGSSADWAEAAASWPGRVFALDFSGHGRSDRVPGSTYLAELLAADADAALGAIGEAAVAGAGVGAYVALLLAGGRRAQVTGALLLAGRGLAGGGPRPNHDTPMLSALRRELHPPLPDGCDPRLCMLETDVRPPEYAVRYARAARRLLLHEDGRERPPWWEAVRDTLHARTIGGDVRAAMDALAAAA